MEKFYLQIAIGLMFLSTPAFASSPQCLNWMSLSQYNYAKTNNGLGTSSAPQCVKTEECICFDNSTEWPAATLVDVIGDDLSSPIYKITSTDVCDSSKDSTCLAQANSKMCPGNETRDWTYDSDSQVYTITCKKIDSYAQIKLYREVQPDKTLEKAIKDAQKAKDTQDKTDKDSRKVKLAALLQTDWSKVTKIGDAVTILKEVITVLKALEDK